MPRLRRRRREDLGLAGCPERKIVALALSLLIDTRMRVGNDCYARENGSFGLTTLGNRPIRFLPGGRARLRFRGKSGVVRAIAERLSNTPAVCRSAYIDPAVFSGWRDGRLAAAAGAAAGPRQWERAAVSFLRGTHRGNAGGDRS